MTEGNNTIINNTINNINKINNTIIYNYVSINIYIYIYTL